MVVLNRAIGLFLRYLPQVRLLVVAGALLIAAIHLWRRLVKAPPGPLFVLPLVGESIPFFRSPAAYMFKRWAAGRRGWRGRGVACS